MSNNNKKHPEKVIEECIRILKSQTPQMTLKWLSDNKFTSYILRNQKAAQTISISNYMIQKIFIGRTDRPHELLAMLVQYHKKNQLKCYEYSRFIKHFSQWDYEFEYLYKIAMDMQKDDIGLYLRLRETVVQSTYNKTKKELLSGITAQLQQWATLAQYIFKDIQEQHVIDQYTQVVKKHYIQFKKSQSERINGAQFFRICQIMNGSGSIQEKQNTDTLFDQNSNIKQAKRQQRKNIVSIFDQSLLSGLSSQDKELIRVLSYKDKNIAKMLEQKHTKMVHLIGQEVDKLRRDINNQKQRYIEVIQQKNALMRLTERIKQCSLRFIIDKNEYNQFQLLQLLETFNTKYNPKATDVAKTTDIINNRRLIEIIQKEQLEQD